jgi:hypothetical protein
LAIQAIANRAHLPIRPFAQDDDALLQMLVEFAARLRPALPRHRQPPTCQSDHVKPHRPKSVSTSRRAALPQDVVRCLSCSWSSLLFFVFVFALRRRIPPAQPSGCGATSPTTPSTPSTPPSWLATGHRQPRPFAHSPKTTTLCRRRSRRSRPDYGLLFHHTVNSRRVDLTTPCLIAQTCRLLVDRPPPPFGGGPPR